MLAQGKKQLIEKWLKEDKVSDMSAPWRERNIIETETIHSRIQLCLPDLHDENLQKILNVFISMMSVCLLVCIYDCSWSAVRILGAGETGGPNFGTVCLPQSWRPWQGLPSLSSPFSFSSFAFLKPSHSLTPHPPTHPPIHSPTHPLTHTSTHSPTHPLTHSPTHPLTHSPTHPLTHTSTHPHIHPLTHTSTHPLTHTSTHPLTHTSTHPLIQTVSPSLCR